MENATVVSLGVVDRRPHGHAHRGSSSAPMAEPVTKCGAHASRRIARRRRGRSVRDARATVPGSATSPSQAGIQTGRSPAGPPTRRRRATKIRRVPEILVPVEHVEGPPVAARRCAKSGVSRRRHPPVVLRRRSSTALSARSTVDAAPAATGGRRVARASATMTTVAVAEQVDRDRSDEVQRRPSPIVVQRRAQRAYGEYWNELFEAADTRRRALAAGIDLFVARHAGLRGDELDGRVVRPSARRRRRDRRRAGGRRHRRGRRPALDEAADPAAHPPGSAAHRDVVDIQPGTAARAWSRGTVVVQSPRRPRSSRYGARAW